MVYILLGEGFEEAEAIVPGDLLRRAGVAVAYVGLEGLAVKGSHGITVTADMTLEQVKEEDMEMLVLPGGLGGVASIQMDLFATALIQKARDRGCWLAAICAAPSILAHMGMLDRRPVTCHPGGGGRKVRHRSGRRRRLPLRTEAGGGAQGRRGGGQGPEWYPVPELRPPCGGPSGPRRRP